MKLAGLAQPPFETTMMGVVKGALDYLGGGFSPAAAYGGSGHAFVINVHRALCPSGPYCWNYAGFMKLLRNLGLEMEDLGFYHAGSGAEDRAKVERRIKEVLDEGRPCSLVNLDNQLICGYDDDKLLAARPWPANPDYPPGTLTYGSWSELGDEVHINFFTFRRLEMQDARTILRDSLAYAVDLHRHPAKHTSDDYGIGPDAYANWLSAIDEHGASHGNWWNATVWSECRRMASEYLAESAGTAPASKDRLAELSRAYGEIAALISRAADRELAAPAKKELVTQAAALEATAVTGIAELLAEL